MLGLALLLAFCCLQGSAQVDLHNGTPGSIDPFTFRSAGSAAVKFSTTFTGGSCTTQPTYVLYPLLQQVH